MAGVGWEDGAGAGVLSVGEAGGAAAGDSAGEAAGEAGEGEPWGLAPASATGGESDEGVGESVAVGEEEVVAAAPVAVPASDGDEVLEAQRCLVARLRGTDQGLMASGSGTSTGALTARAWRL